ncbi:HEXXH motif domain-containing protein [Streptomyces sp. NPDC059454]|uniref:HEXXH motif domain-containing protein n=1 Tax=Streptomyces sp. NPDC059454 TaxID=3346836 RepID=UPI0036CECA38
MFHELSAEGLGELLRGAGDSEVVGELWRAERSRRLLFLRAFLDQAGTPGPAGEGRWEASVKEAWALLERVQDEEPQAVEDAVMAPGTGVWVASVLRCLRDSRTRARDTVPVEARVGHLAALAATAAARAGIRFDIAVPMRRGFVPFPGLGCAVLPVPGESPEWASALVTGEDGRLRITAGDAEVVVGADREVPSPGWLPTRRLTWGRPEASTVLAASVVLEAHDPYRAFSGPGAPRAVAEGEVRLWRSLLAEAWEVLSRAEPAQAEAMRHAVVSVAPAERRERFRPYSSSAGEAFGGVHVSLPDGAAQLAATLTHEFQHIKLGALIHLEPLLRRTRTKEDRRELFYAPWRDDPRPLDGLLQGIYAFFGVARFWRAHRRVADGAEAALAHFEFALWREQVGPVLNRVRHHERLTALGRRLLETLAEECAAWPDEDVPGTELRMAREAVADHRARWREHHVRPPEEGVDEAVRAWREGAERPSALLAGEPRVSADPGAGFLDTAAVLARHRLTDPEGDWRAEGAVRGAGVADVLLCCGEREAARRVLVEQLAAGKGGTGAWAVLGRALSGGPTARDAAAAQVLLRRPERVRAVHEALCDGTGERVDPVRLAAWVGGAGRGL